MEELYLLRYARYLAYAWGSAGRSARLWREDDRNGSVTGEDGEFYCFWTQTCSEKHARFFYVRSVHDHVARI